MASITIRTHFVGLLFAQIFSNTIKSAEVTGGTVGVTETGEAVSRAVTFEDPVWGLGPDARDDFATSPATSRDRPYHMTKLVGCQNKILC